MIRTRSCNEVMRSDAMDSFNGHGAAGASARASG
jgi:hypothetical protein